MEPYLPNIPHEIIYNILSRLPVKPLCRFKSVSRPWLDLITNPLFIKAHLNQSTKGNTTQKLFLNSFTSLSFYSIDYQSPDHTVAERLMFCKSRVDVLGSVNGVVLIYTDNDKFYLWNPSTKMCRNFSPPCYPNPIAAILYALGYDSVSDDFKVVRTVNRFRKVPCAAQVFSSKLNSWKRIEDCGYLISPYDPSNVLHGMPHWVSCSTNRSFLASSISNMIVCFDATEERFKEVPQPNYEGKDKHIGLGVLGGCLCVVQKHQDNNADVWVMKEYGVKESWTKLLVVPNGSGEFFFDFCMPLYYTKDGVVVMVLNSEKLVIYNPKEKRFKTIGIPQDREKFDVCVYVESLLSPYGGNQTNLPLIRSTRKRKSDLDDEDVLIF